MDFCVECGAEEELHGHLCKKCLLSKDLVTTPEHLSIVLCHACGRVLRGSKWSDISPEEEVRHLLEKETKKRSEVAGLEWDIPFFEPEKGEHRLECVSLVSIGEPGADKEEPLELPFRLSVKVRIQMCQPCSRQRSDYFEAIIQLRKQITGARSSGDGMEHADEMILDSVSELGQQHEMGFLTKTGKVTGGRDYYLGSVALARVIAKRMKDSMGATINESNSQMGMKDGRDIYRWTILVRLPAVKKGDVVVFEKELHAVNYVARKTITLRHLENGRMTRIKTSDNPKLVSSKEELEQAVVVSEEADTIQVLDPENMKTVTVARPKEMETMGETVDIVRFKGELFIVSN